jgi:hypothetical protein
MSSDEYWLEPQGDYDARRLAFLRFSAAAKPVGGRTGFFSQISRLALDQPIDEEVVYEALSSVESRQDCADFTAVGLLRILYQYADNPHLSQSLVEAIRRTLLGFKYWIDEPGQEMMCFWSENHQLLFHAAEYLAGQLFVDEIFPNVGQSGRWHMEKARPKILRWIDLKARIGFSEWDSNCYYDEDMAPLLNLADFADDEAIRTKAARLLDIMFFDIAVDSFRGTYGTSHGRTYPRHVLSGRHEATAGVGKIAWGMGIFNDASNMTAVSLANSRRYRVPPIVERIAQHLPEEVENRERHSLCTEEAERFGIRFDELDTAMLLWGAGQFAHRRNVEDTLKLADRIESHRFNVVIRPYVEAIYGTYCELEAQGIPHDGDIDRTTLAEVNKYTFRTPDYQLSTAQDYRKGKPGFQQHIWQATLGPDAVLFTLHRGNEDEVSYKYWVGRFPRAAQYRNVLIALYHIPEAPLPGPATVVPADAGGNAMPSPGPAQEDLLSYTVAILRRAAFDEVVERNGWVLARKGLGYVALRSQQPAHWSADGVLQGEGLIAEGRRNIWICQMGRQAVDGSFAAWVERIASASLNYADLAVDYEAPGIGQVHFGWEGPLTVNGESIALDNYMRFDNPYCQAAFGEARYEIVHAGERTVIDFGAPAS